MLESLHPVYEQVIQPMLSNEVTRLKPCDGGVELRYRSRYLPQKSRLSKREAARSVWDWLQYLSPLLRVWRGVEVLEGVEF